MPKRTNKAALKCPVVRARVFGVKVYRGFANLADLADISKADVYDQQKNPKGTQRDLNEPHARHAYEYAKNEDLGFWPEVFLCARKKDVLTFYPISEEFPELGTLEIDVKGVQESTAIAISRIDGNHRLHFGNGKLSGYSRVEKLVSFCLAYGLSRDEEVQLFKDINDNQRQMNTSHLDRIEVRLTPEEELKQHNPELYIAQQLGRDSASPFHRRVYEGGKKPVGVDIPLRGLKTGIEYMFSQSTQLPHLEDAEAQYRVIRNYFEAVKKWQPKAWKSPKEYIMLRGSGLWAICFIGAHVIDRALLQAEFKSSQMLTILRSGKEWDWGTKGDFKGFSGRGGAVEISKAVTRKLQDETRISTKELLEKIMSEGSSG